MVKPFDPNAPRDHDRLSRFRSFQTGHNPATHAGAYALDRAYPAKLQPDLLERYFEISKAWHQFLAIDKEETIQTEVTSDVSKLSLGTALDAPSSLPHCSTSLLNETSTHTNVPSLEGVMSQLDTSVIGENEQSRKRKRSLERSMSPIQRQINNLRTDLAELEHEQEMQKICKAASQGVPTQGNGSDQSSMPLYRKRGSQVSLSNCAEHRTAVINLDKHLSQHHSVPASARRQIVNCFSRLKQLDPAEIKLPEEPAQPIEELGRPLTRLQCRTCRFITINEDEIQRHCKKHHQLAWVGEKSELCSIVKVQSFFRAGGLQKYFIVI
jgi:hypothetical protein